MNNVLLCRKPKGYFSEYTKLMYGHIIFANITLPTDIADVSPHDGLFHHDRNSQNTAEVETLQNHVKVWVKTYRIDV